ncbi:hypothetical protein ISCGN_006123, partial [Ixodes scapularis]
RVSWCFIAIATQRQQRHGTSPTIGYACFRLQLGSSRRHHSRNVSGTRFWPVSDPCLRTLGGQFRCCQPTKGGNRQSRLGAWNRHSHGGALHAYSFSAAHAGRVSWCFIAIATQRQQRHGTSPTIGYACFRLQLGSSRRHHSRNVSGTRFWPVSDPCLRTLGGQFRCCQPTKGGNRQSRLGAWNRHSHGGALHAYSFSAAHA